MWASPDGHGANADPALPDGQGLQNWYRNALPHPHFTELHRFVQLKMQGRVFPSEKVKDLRRLV